MVQGNAGGVEVKNEKDYLSPAELTDDEARGQITKVRSPWQKRGSSVFWRVWREDRKHAMRGI